MHLACWSVKGGSGTTVVTGALALASARPPADRTVLLVDLGGDLPAVLGLGDDGPGLADWSGTATEVAADGLARLERPVVPGLQLLPRGSGELAGGGRAELLRELLAAESRTVVVDCGLLGPGPGGDRSGLGRSLAATATHSWLVTRPCYLALRRAQAAPVRPSGVVLVDEPGRALDRHDVEDVLDLPVVTTVTVDAAVARAVDAGLLAARVPRSLRSLVAP